MAWIIPRHIPAQDGDPDNGLEGVIRSTNGSSDRMNTSYQNNKYGQDPYPTAEATLSAACLRQPGAKIPYQKTLNERSEDDRPRFVVFHLRNHAEPPPELVTTFSALW